MNIEEGFLFLSFTSFFSFRLILQRKNYSSFPLPFHFVTTWFERERERKKREIPEVCNQSFIHFFRIGSTFFPSPLLPFQVHDEWIEGMERSIPLLFHFLDFLNLFLSESFSDGRKNSSQVLWLVSWCCWSFVKNRKWTSNRGTTKGYNWWKEEWWEDVWRKTDRKNREKRDREKVKEKMVWAKKCERIFRGWIICNVSEGVKKDNDLTTAQLYWWKEGRGEFFSDEGRNRRDEKKNEKGNKLEEEDRSEKRERNEIWLVSSFLGSWLMFHSMFNFIPLIPVSSFSFFSLLLSSPSLSPQNFSMFVSYSMERERERERELKCEG